jgi:hypothetical protein
MHRISMFLLAAATLAAAAVGFVAAAPSSGTKDDPSPILSERGKLLFSDDFSEPTGSRWTTRVGDWKVADGVLTGSEREADQHGAVARHAIPMKDAIIQFQFKLDGTKGISLSVNDAKEHVCRLMVNPRGFSLRKDDHDHAGPDKAKVFETRTLMIKPGEWHTALVEMRGGEMVAQIDDLKPSFGEDELIKADKANFGFTVAGQSASFRNVRVWEALPNPAWSATKAKLSAK